MKKYTVTMHVEMNDDKQSSFVVHKGDGLTTRVFLHDVIHQAVKGDVACEITSHSINVSYYSGKLRYSVNRERPWESCNMYDALYASEEGDDE